MQASLTHEVSVPNRSRLDSDLGDGNSRRDVEGRGVDDLDGSTGELSCIHLRQVECEGAGDLALRVGDHGRVDGRRGAREDVELLGWDMVERGDVGLEVLGEHFLGDVREPVGELEGGVLAECAGGEDLARCQCQQCVIRRISGTEADQQELSTVRCRIQALERVRDAGREVPEITGSLRNLSEAVS